MEWIQIISLFLANAGLIVWFRAESRNDWRHMDAKLDAYQRDTTQILNSIKDEMKDFHIRLEKQDADFRETMARQDAEFKAHMMYYHLDKEK